jgi:hypothetical protein
MQRCRYLIYLVCIRLHLLSLRLSFQVVVNELQLTLHKPAYLNETTDVSLIARTAENLKRAAEDKMARQKLAQFNAQTSSICDWLTSLG